MAIMAQIVKPVSFSRTWTFFEGGWHEGNVPIMGPRTHAAWLGSTVFDGARAFEGVAPDLDRHCARINQSAINFGLKPVVDTDTWLGLAREGMARFDAKAELYIRPMYWAQTGSGGGWLFDPETTNWCLSLYVAPMPPTSGSAITLSPFRRPTMENAPVDCKAACLYQIGSGNNERVSEPLCGADAADIGLGDHAVAIPPADDGKCAGGLQGGLPLSDRIRKQRTGV